MEEGAEEGVPPAPSPDDAADSGSMAGIPGIEALIALRRNHSAGQASDDLGGRASELAREGLSATHREALVLEYGEESVSSIEATARELFVQLDTERDGHLTLQEFAKTLGQLGVTSPAEGQHGLAAYMFHAVDVDDSGTITFDEFSQWMLTMLRGTPQSKLRLGFNICDLDKSGSINRSEVAVLLDSIFSMLSGLSLGEHNPEVDNMLDALFRHSADNSSLTWEQYCKACVEDKDMISHLGHERLVSSVADTASGEANQKQMGSLAFFGQARCELMLSLMVGLQIAVEHTSATDASDAATIVQTWSKRQQDEGDTEGGTEPVPERVYRIPSARDSQELANDHQASALLAATTAESSSGGDEATTDALGALVSASTDTDLRPAIGRALAGRVHESFSALHATDASPENTLSSLVLSTLEAAVAILEAATLQDHRAQSDAFTPVHEDIDGLMGDKEGPEFLLEQEVQAAIVDGLHIGYVLADGKYMRLHTSRGLFSVNKEWKPGSPKKSVQKVWKYTGGLKRSQHDLAVALEESGFVGVVSNIRDNLQTRADVLQQTSGHVEQQLTQWETTVLSLANKVLNDLREMAPPPQVASWTSLGWQSAGLTESRATITVIGGQLFREIRAAFGISDREFLGALGIRQVIGGLLMGDLRGLSELVSEGKSGSLFFWSHDGKFMVKTINVDERDSLRQMLRPYRSYITSHPDTLLTKYLGLYDLTFPNVEASSGTTTYHLVVMKNVFNTDLQIEERFDLKGSTHQRTVGEELRGTPGLVHKDLDFEQMRRHIAVSSESLAEQLRSQIRMDASFLASQGVIDYSLLLGVAKVRQTATPLQHEMETLGSPEFSTWLSKHEAVLRTSYDAVASAGACNTAELPFEGFARFVFQHRNQDEANSACPLLDAASDSKHTDAQQELAGPAHGTLFTHNQGGILGSSHKDESEEEVLFVGVIDTLVPFKIKKKAEFLAKSVIQRGQNFSVIPPEEYASRFIEANTAIVCHK